MKTYCDLAIVY